MEFAAFRDVLKQTSSCALDKDLLQRYAKNKNNPVQSKLQTKQSKKPIVNDLEAAINDLLVANRQRKVQEVESVHWALNL